MATGSGSRNTPADISPAVSTSHISTIKDDLNEFMKKMIGNTGGSGATSTDTSAATGTVAAGDVQQYNQTYPRGGGPTLPFNAVAKIAESVGLPGITFAQIAQGESALKPGAVSNDGGYGMWQMTPRVQSSATVQHWQSIGSYFNPVANAKMALFLLGGHYTESGGKGNWYGISHVTDWNAHYTGK